MTIETTRPVAKTWTSAELLRIEALEVDLGRGRHRASVLRGVDLTVGRGEIVGLIGETGSGKTTLAGAVLGLAPVRAGSVRLNSRETARLSRSARRALRRAGEVQYVFQDPLRSLDPDLMIRDSLIEGLVVRGGLSRGDLTRVATEALDAVSLPHDVLTQYPGRLSGGQRQRVAIARALVLEPDLLVCDEPVSALDAANRIRILDLLSELRATRDLGVLLITHDLGSLAGVADRVSVLHRGVIVETGTTLDIFTNPQHPYTKLLVASVPSLFGEPASSGYLASLREQVAQS